MTSQNKKEFGDNILQQIKYSEDALGRPLLNAFNIDSVSITFLCYRRIQERDGGYFPYLVLYLRRVRTYNFVSMNQDTHFAFY